MKWISTELRRFLPGLAAGVLIIFTTSLLLLLSIEADKEPRARIIHDLDIVEVGGSVFFDGRNSTDPDGEGLDYHWTINETVHVYEPFFQFSFPTPGNYSVVLEVTDVSGDLDTDTVIIDVR